MVSAVPVTTYIGVRTGTFIPDGEWDGDLIARKKVACFEHRMETHRKWLAKRGLKQLYTNLFLSWPRFSKLFPSELFYLL